jgi:hypothetical protein
MPKASANIENATNTATNWTMIGTYIYMYWATWGATVPIDKCDEVNSWYRNG